MKPASTALVMGLLFFPFFLSFDTVLPQQTQAQESTYQTTTEEFSREELAQMLAPIALYPDALLSQVLMASTYPIEVIEADRWVRRNSELKDERLDLALADQDWDPSVKAICHFPSVLTLMSDNITETVNIGNAFLAQEDEVIDMIQELRNKAYASGNLTSTQEQRVVVEKETIIIEPADPRVIYVPYYDPLHIYGPWWYPAYPPYYWGPAGISIGLGISYWPGFYFGFTFGSWSYFDWPYHHIYIDVRHRPRYVRHDRWPVRPGRWTHRPEHRRGVAYRDKYTARKYGQQPRHSREFQPDTRGFPVRRERDRDSSRRTTKNRSEISRDTQQEARPRIDRQQRQHEEQPRLKQQLRERVERQAESPGPDRIKPDRNKLDRERSGPKRQTEQLSGRQRQSRQEFESQQQKRSRENVFNRVDEGDWERRSSQRGWHSRRSGDNWRDRAGSGGRDRGRSRR